MSEPLRRRRTRIVCISDTHNQTPSLPQGDVLIHAGDLTNQGSLPELRKTVTWLEKANFEEKIVVAGNHDITLDAEFYEKNWSCFHNQRKQDGEECRALLKNSKSITYLEHESYEVRLTKPDGPRTHFKIFGSPWSPRHGLWGFGYEQSEAEGLWKAIPEDADIVVTHTPPKGHCDRTVSKNGRAGCEALRRRLGEVRPCLHVCGHMHEGRGAETIVWKDRPSIEEESSRFWSDPGLGEGNRKQSILSLMPEKPSEFFSTRVARSRARAAERRRRGSSDASTSSSSSVDVEGKDTTCIVNAAVTQNSFGGPKRLNKLIVVDIDLPTCDSEENGL